MLEALDSAGHLHEEPAPHVHFSYSRKEHGLPQRLVIRLIERLTSQPRLERLYRAWAENPHPHENIFAAGLRLLNLRLDMDGAALAKIPRSGPVLFVDNHPMPELVQFVATYLTRDKCMVNQSPRTRQLRSSSRGTALPRQAPRQPVCDLRTALPEPFR
jgi:hypothetical protein